MPVQGLALTGGGCGLCRKRGVAMRRALAAQQVPASAKQRISGRIMTAVERVRVDDETNLRDILDRVHEISIEHIDDTHFFTLSQVYEDLLLKMGEKNSDGGQFFTPREVVRAMVRARHSRRRRSTRWWPGSGRKSRMW